MPGTRAIRGVCMSRHLRILTLLPFLALALFAAGCGPGGQAGKIPITTKSKEARQAYLEARGLAEALRGQNAIASYQKAVSLDSTFALAELGLANTSPTAKEGFEHLAKAVRLAAKVSAGERMLILATEAGLHGNAAQQREQLTKLVAAFPKDERAQLNLGAYLYGVQDFDGAIGALKKATELAPDFSPPYNMLGYSYREEGLYPEAKQAFEKYIELIPNDPNPYDSDAELLLKMGRFAESIASYRKALSFDSLFVSSHIGVAAAQLYMGQPKEASATLARLSDLARNDGERRAALYAMAVVAADGGRLPDALAQVASEYAVAEKTGDVASMSADLRNRGAILVEMGKYDEAGAAFERALQLIQDSDLAADIKENAAFSRHYDEVQVALGRRQLEVAKAEAAQFQQAVAAKGNPTLTKLAHELAGAVALAQKDHATAITELQQASQQDPYNLYRLALAFQAGGDREKARDYLGRAAHFYSLPALNYAFIRARAGKALAAMKG
jgi:tetratricopeptide (TPR) repeat protein